MLAVTLILPEPPHNMVATAVGSSPERFERQVRSAVEMARRAPTSEQMIVVKSWNEWAEGNYLEPDREFGRGWLEALARGLGAPGA